MTTAAATVPEAPRGRLEIDRLETALRDGDRRFRVRVEGVALQPGAVVGLTGASGSGKTLVLELLGLLRRPEPGAAYRWRDGGGGHDLAALWAGGTRSAALARGRGAMFGFVPQTGGLVPFLSVAENIALPQRVTGRRDAALCDTLCSWLGLWEVRHLRPAALSIGQRQRCAIARALAHRPPFVIADEPTAALDPEAADTVLGLLIEAAVEGGAGVVLSSHDVDRIARFGIPRLRLVTETAADGEVVSRLEPAPC